MYKKQPFPQWKPTQSMKLINVEGPSFINNLDSDQSKCAKNVCNFWMDSTPPSKAILFFVFQADQNKYKGFAFQTALRFLPTKDPFHPKRVSPTEEGNTHTSLVFSRWRRRWLMDSSCAWHKQHLFAKAQPLFWTWSKVRTFPHDVSQAKKLTFGCTLDFHIIFIGNLVYIVDHIMSLLDFIDWLSLKRGKESCYSFPWSLLGVFEYFCVYFATPPFRHH